MAVAKSKVIEGEFKDKWVFCFGKKPFIKIKVPATAPLFGVQKKVFLDSNTVSNYQILDSTSDVSFTSTMVRGAVGQAVAGNVGGIAGAMTATGYSSNIILITFKDGKKSLIDVNDMRCFKERM